eukprot:6349181-Amphidinium_carterae.1
MAGADVVQHASAMSMQFHSPAPNCETQSYLCKRESNLDNTFVNLCVPPLRPLRRSVSAPCLLAAQEDHASSNSVPTSAERSVEQAPRNGVSQAHFTTVIVRNLPVDVDQVNVHRALKVAGFANTYDYLYVPARFIDGTCLGYGFINFMTHELAAAFMQSWQGSTLYVSSWHKKTLA